jgi:outer membrane protein assembly factor BamB
MKYTALVALLLAAPAARAADWPGFLGPTADGKSPETGIIAPWPKEGLKKLWECDLGVGYAPPVVADGRLFHFDRFGDNARLTCRDAATGKELWKFEYPMEYEDVYGYDPGPRSCPVVDGDRVYIHGVEGMVHCVRAADGKPLWKFDTLAKYNFHQNFFGAGGAPVVWENLVIVPVGGSEKGPRPVDFRDVKPNGTAIVAFDKMTGKLVYETGDELASYATPVVATIAGKPTGLYFARGGLLGFDPKTGKQLFHFPWRAPDLESVNAADPVAIGDKVLLSECYGRDTGAVLLDLKDGKPKVVWSDADRDRLDKSLQCHWNTPIAVGGFVYGSSARHTPDAELRCIDLKTGEVKWAKRRTTRCTLTLVDGHFVCLSEYGTLSLVKVNPEKCEVVSEYEVPELVFPCWAPPVLSNGVLYLRGKRTLVALELIPKKP